MSTRHDPAAAVDAEAAGDDSAWLDTAPAGESAWDDLSDGDASAWAGSGESSASVWDDDAPAPATVWEDDAPPPASGRDDDAAQPSSPWAGDTWAHAPVEDHDAAPRTAWGDDSRTAPRATARPRTSARSRTAAATAAPAEHAPRPRTRTGGPATTSEEQSPEVAAVAARLAEIVARSGGARPAPVVATPAAATPAVATPSVDPGAVDPGAVDPGTADPGAVDPAAADAPDSALGPRRGGARRRTTGRRRAPATEPPEAGAAAADAEPDAESVARAIALRQLTAAPRSRFQLAEAMAKRDVPEDVADRVLDRFTEVGLVDDAAYAEVLVRSRHAERGMSRRALAMELRRKGVDDEVAREALEQVDDADEEQAARALARKKLRATRGLDREVRLRRAYGALGRRGYGGSLVSRVVREELDAEGTDAADPGDGWTGGLDSA
jgi:SOS response regulatory protein OraA/RecX